MQTKLNRETAKELFKLNPKALEMIAKCTDDFMFISLMTAEQMKSDAQNRLFHGLLSCFWDSGCSSFASPFDMKLYYKDIAGLVEYKYQSKLDEYTKTLVHRCFKLVKLQDLLSEEQWKNVCLSLKGEVVYIHSWSKATKEQAQIAIDRLLNDMDASGVIGSKMGKQYETILKGIGEII